MFPIHLHLSCFVPCLVDTVLAVSEAVGSRGLLLVHSVGNWFLVEIYRPLREDWPSVKKLVVDGECCDESVACSS